MLRIFFLFVFSAIILSACQLASLTSKLFDTPSGAVLYQDDFSDPASGWQIFNDSQAGSLDYFNGYFRIQVLGERQMLSTGPGLKFTDLQLDADVIKVIGLSDDMFGLVCRAVDAQNFYFFVISSDGYYGIGKMIQGNQIMLSSPGMLPSEAIKQDKSKNHLQVECIADQLIFSVNGQVLAHTQDADLTQGDVGVLAGTLMDSEIVVLFDNFSVTKP